MDILPGLKTQITAIVAAVFNILSLLGIITLDEGMVDSINQILLYLLGLFFAMKVQRNGGLRR